MSEVTPRELFYQDGPLHLHGGLPRLMKVTYNRITYRQFKSRVRRLIRKGSVQVRQYGLQPGFFNDCYFIREPKSGATIAFMPIFSPISPRSIVMLYMEFITYRMKNGNITDVKVVTKEVARHKEIKDFFQGVVQYIFATGA